MTTIQFKPLCSLQVTHGYYEGACGDLGFFIPDDVAQTMRGVGLLARSQDDRLVVLRRDGPGPQAVGKTLRFGLLAHSSSFANITEGFDPGAGVLVYRNRSTPAALDDPPVRQPIGGPFVAAPLTLAERPVTMTAKNPAGRALLTVTVTAASGASSASFDFTGVAPGELTFEEATKGAAKHVTSFYLDPELARAAAFAVVELRVDASFLTNAPTFTIAFPARQETLRYYVVARGFSSGDVDQLVVQDHGFGAPGRPEVKFEKAPPASLSDDEKASTALLGNDGARVLLFRSSTAVPRRQAGRRRIQLLRNNEALIENLPQPGRDRVKADLVVHLSKSKA